MQRPLHQCRSHSTVHTACIESIDYVENWDSVSRVFVLGKSHPLRAFPLLEDSEFLLLLSLSGSFEKLHC